MISLNQNLAVIYSSCSKWHMRLNLKKTKYILVSRSRSYVPGYGDVTLGGAELETVDSVRILGIALDSKFTFETQLPEVVSKTASRLGVVCRARKLFDCSRVVKSCFDVFVLSYLGYCASVWMSSAEPRVCLLERMIHRAKRLCEGKLRCLVHERRVSVLCLLYKIYHRAGYPFHDHLYHFVVACNTSASAALDELALVIRRRRID